MYGVLHLFFVSIPSPSSARARRVGYACARPADRRWSVVGDAAAAAVAVPAFPSVAGNACATGRQGRRRRNRHPSRQERGRPPSLPFCGRRVQARRRRGPRIQRFPRWTDPPLFPPPHPTTASCRPPVPSLVPRHLPPLATASPSFPLTSVSRGPCRPPVHPLHVPHPTRAHASLSRTAVGGPPAKRLWPVPRGI